MPIGSYSFDSPYAPEMLDIERRRKIAEILQQQAAQPLDPNQMAGGYVVPISPLSGLAKLGQAAFAGSSARGIDERLKRLAETVRGDRANTIKEFTAAKIGTPGFEDEIGVQVPAQKPDLARAYGILAESRDPALSQLGLAQLLKTGSEQFGKIEPKDYTPESIVKFSQTMNYADLVPRVKYSHLSNVAGPQGPQTMFYDPERPPAGALAQAVEPKVVETAGPTGAPQTSFVNPYAQQAPLPKPVRQEMVNTGSVTQAVNPYSPPLMLQNTVSPNTAATNAVTMRGQDLTNARALDQNAIANNTRITQLVEGHRKEFNALPEVKNYKETLPILESVKKAPDTPAGDIDLIYAVGKIMDPNSVVREGELNLVIKAGSPAQRFQGWANYVKGGGRLPPAQRAELMDVLNNRVGALQNNYNQAAGEYGRIVAQQGIDPGLVIPQLVNPLSAGGEAPPGVDPKLWAAMTPEQRALWKR